MVDSIMRNCLNLYIVYLSSLRKFDELLVYKYKHGKEKKLFKTAPLIFVQYP